MRKALALMMLAVLGGIFSGSASADDLLLGQSVAAWQRELASPQPLTRRQAAANLANRASPACITGLKSQDEVVRYWSALGLAMRIGQLPQKSAEQAELVKVLAAQLTDGSPSVRTVAAFGVGQGGNTKTAVPILIGLLDDPQPAVATQALSFLDQLGDAGRPYEAKLKTITQSGTEYPKRLAERMLKRWNP